MKGLGLYIHIPFCKRKCHYCDFISYPDRELHYDAYIDALIHETHLYHDYLKDSVVNTVFIGGGTPSLLSSEQITRLIAGLKDNCNWIPRELTIEANPETVSEEKLAAYADIGINRLSMGLQTHENDILAQIGRRHTFATFLSAFETAKKYFDNINVDTMFGLPGQSLSSFEQTMQHMIDLSPAHISSYALKLEVGTKLAQEFSGIDDDTDREMYHSAVRMLQDAGYTHYETSNFSIEHFECQHNLKYWTGQETLGLGVAAHSYIAVDNKNRFSNMEGIDEYLTAIKQDQKPVTQTNIISLQEEKQEFMMLRLRLTTGIVFKEYYDLFNEEFELAHKNAIQTALMAHLITADTNGIYPTLKGFDLQNTLITEFMKKV